MNLRPSVNRRRSWVVGAFVVGLLLVIFFYRGFVVELITPLLRAFSRSGSLVTVSFTSEQQERLEDRIKTLAIDRVEFERLKSENKTLRKELGFLERTGFQAVGTSVLSKSLSQTVARFVLDVGSDQGVHVGDPIVADDGLLVGTIEQVEKKFSTAIALTDSTTATAVSLLNDRRTIGVANGTVGGLLEIRFIPADETIEVNDLVVTSGLEQTVPSGLLIGLVNAVELDQNTLFLTAMVEPLQDIRRLSHVLVLTKDSL